jgi:hypothetical protein
MSKLSELAGKRNWAIGRLSFIQANFKNLCEEDCFTEYERIRLVAAINEIKVILDTKDSGYRAVKNKLLIELGLYEYKNENSI